MVKKNMETIGRLSRFDYVVSEHKFWFENVEEGTVCKLARAVLQDVLTDTPWRKNWLWK
jgi:hypothetical protein